MSQITTTVVTVNLDRQAAIRTGHNVGGNPIQIAVDVSQLTQDQRDYFAAAYGIADGNVQGVDRNSPILRNRKWEGGRVVDYCAALTIPAPTVEALLAVIDQRQAEIRTGEIADAAARAAKLAKESADRAARVARMLAGRDEDWLYRECYADLEYSQPTGQTARVRSWRVTYTTDPELEPLYAAMRDRSAQLNRELAESGHAAVATWISQHGSTRLQRLVAEGISCHDTYRRERESYDAAEFDRALANERPGWKKATSSIEPVSDVGERSFALLDVARRVAPAAKLGRHDGRIVAVETFLGETIIWPRD